MKIKDIPEYVLNPSYKMTHILVAEVADGLYQYRRCFTTKSSSTRCLHKVNKYCPNVHFEVVTIEEAKKLKV
jgi:hypothetical protein